MLKDDSLDSISWVDAGLRKIDAGSGAQKNRHRLR